jgi:nucleotide-binding universal stress UspA family protein
MYKHILIPVDDSRLSDEAVEHGVAFARSIQARITGFTALEEYQSPSESAILPRTAVSPTEYEKRAKERAQALLEKLVTRARAAGVDCDTDYAFSDRPYDAIIRAAKKHGCDLILMGSHGRGAFGALLQGSEAQGVLSHSNIPTLIYR